METKIANEATSSLRDSIGSSPCTRHFVPGYFASSLRDSESNSFRCVVVPGGASALQIQDPCHPCSSVAFSAVSTINRIHYKLTFTTVNSVFNTPYSLVLMSGTSRYFFSFKS